jgi:hypothetical protein
VGVTLHCFFKFLVFLHWNLHIWDQIHWLVVLITVFNSQSILSVQARLCSERATVDTTGLGDSSIGMLLPACPRYQAWSLTPLRQSRSVWNLLCFLVYELVLYIGWGRAGQESVSTFILFPCRSFLCWKPLLDTWCFSFYRSGRLSHVIQVSPCVTPGAIHMQPSGCSPNAPDADK